MTEPTQPSITVTVKLFAAFQEACGAGDRKLVLPAKTQVSTILDQLIQEYPELERWRSQTRFGINLQFVPGDTPLQEGDEVVLIPPVSGG